MADVPPTIDDTRESPAWSFWLVLGLTIVVALGALFPPLRSVLLAVFLAPFSLIAAVIPGTTPAEDAMWAGRALGALLLIPAGLVALCGLAMVPTSIIKLPQPRWAEQGLSRLLSALEVLVRWVGTLAQWLGLFLVLTVVLVVAQRYAFGVAFAKLQEAIIYLHALLFMLAIPVTLQRGGHVRVDVFYSKLPAVGRAWLDYLGAALFAALCAGIIIWVSRGYVGLSWRVLEGSSETSGLQLVYLLKTSIQMFAGLLLLQAAAMAVRALDLAWKRGEPTP